ncbi:hypothetical protein QBZ16_002001 [Prototheca wickerhamii]|uniref:JmjC domain-containing protein n=1 Tax=Prototheca wickerhamii TaxID=3111 RepID=A0AAD9MNU6_PROWI|nr:hypothetical protein QBZ16_002001 [Prototheca wickerhamii]
MTASDFQKMATSPAHLAPEPGHRQDEFLERSFWSSVTINPPLYGADTPYSFFDDKLEYGWNLRRLGCLLSDYDVPEIPGVTSPMAYFGSWKSFFGWHKEDIDLYSINYNHVGAAKIWYCVSPRDGPKFDAMARSLFPELHAACPAFVRHKDILISPRLLRAGGVPFVQARQEPGEFIVLNAAAYHSGFNLGFNLAEAVNFALPEWLDIGRHAVNCECQAMPDAVCLDMGIFFPELREESESDSESERGSDATSEASDAGTSSEERPASSSSSDEEAESSEQSTCSTAHRAGKAGGKGAARAGAKARAAGAAGAAGVESDSSTATEVTVPARQRKRKAPAAPPAAKKRPKAPAKAPRPGPVPPPTPTQRTSVRTGRGRLPAGSLHVSWGAVAEERPVALVERVADAPRTASFSIVHRLARPAGKAGALWLGELREGPDGLYRPTGSMRQVVLSTPFPKLVRVRCEWSQRPTERRRGGWRLITLPKRILM